MSALRVLVFTGNNFHGSIPGELGHLSRLQLLQVYANYLSGFVPASIYNISSLYYFSFTQNQLHGRLPPDVGLTLPNLQVFAGGVNNLTGPIPFSLSNASGLEIIDFAINGLSGTIPSNLGNLQQLSRLNFEENNLENGETGDMSFLHSLANCTALRVLSFAQNRLKGELPSSIFNLSSLEIFTMGSNLIHGNIPIGIGNLVNLFSLGLEYNYLSGNVPDVLGKLKKLEGLELHANNFSGPMPPSLGNLTILTMLFLGDNNLWGSIPPGLGNFQKLLALNLSDNSLSGSIPRAIFGLSSLSISLSMSRNALSGSLPFEVGQLTNLVELDLSENKLSGDVPSSIGSCTSLERLLVGGNMFEGIIPTSMKALRGLEELDLSRNNFSGQIPEFLSNMSSLKHLNLSYNNLEGEVLEEGIFSNDSSISLNGNKNLCGGIPQLHLPACSRKSPRNNLKRKVLISIVCAAIFVIGLSCSIFTYKMVKKSSRGNSRSSFHEDWQSGISYSDVFKLTDGFSGENLIGSGSFGCVYKGNAGTNGKAIAIKVLNLQQQGASKSFIDECNILRSVRHRNLLKIITACSSVDHQGNDFKALVFEFMVNGSLDKWLHPRADYLYSITKLSLVQRLNIAIDIASALDYLHHECHTPIVHCDLKPSNVLLDEDMVAHVADFGLARFLLDSSNNPSNNQTISNQLKGSIGYIPPEYGMSGDTSKYGDIYSYGVMLLEIFTGKRPTDDMFKDDMSIHKFVEMAWPEHVMEIVDPSMLSEEENHSSEAEEKRKGQKEETTITGKYNNRVGARSLRQECLVSVLEIGLICSATSPSDRMITTSVVNRLQDIKNLLFRTKC